MIAQNKQGHGLADTMDNPLAITLANSIVHEIAFIAGPADGQSVLFDFPAPLGHRAVLVTSHAPHTATTTDAPLAILSLPTTGSDLDPEHESQALAQLREWVESAGNSSQLLTLQNTRIFWSPERIAILAQADRLETVRAALIEATYYETEVSALERQLGTAWPQLEKDMPLAFEFEASSLPQRNQLRRRFHEVLLLRAKLARLGPHVHCPHQHPPTLASQIGERLRERTRLVHRHEFLTEQVEVFERVYEMCGQKASDYALARQGHLLEWVLIVLLFVSTLLQIFEIMSNASTATPSAAVPVTPISFFPSSTAAL